MTVSVQVGELLAVDGAFVAVTVKVGDVLDTVAYVAQVSDSEKTPV